MLVNADGAGPVVGSRRLFTSIAVSGSGPNAIIGVEVSKKDSNGVDRSSIELRIVAWSILFNGLGVTPADVLIRQEIGKTRFDKIMKEQVFRGTDGAIYKVIQEPTA